MNIILNHPQESKNQASPIISSLTHQQVQQLTTHCFRLCYVPRFILAKIWSSQRGY